VASKKATKSPTPYSRPKNSSKAYSLTTISVLLPIYGTASFG
jgi:hypothetical protein